MPLKDFREALLSFFVEIPSVIEYRTVEVLGKKFLAMWVPWGKP